MGRRLRAEHVLFEMPIVGETIAGRESDRPVVVFAVDRITQRLTLGMTLDADVVAPDIVEPVRVDDVENRRIGDVCAAGAMTLFAADVPLGDLFRRCVVIGRTAFYL